MMDARRKEPARFPRWAGECGLGFRVANSGRSKNARLWRQEFYDPSIGV